MKNIFWIVVLIVVVAIGGALLFIYWDNIRAAGVDTFTECRDRGFPVSESFPAVCSAPGGKTFTEDIGNLLEKENLIRIETPRPNEIIKSPMVVEGEARGFWFFEASFPVRVKDANGKELGVGIAQAQGEWMTEEFVPFNTVMEFAEPETETGTLILEKDNPSGLPENADEMHFPVRFR
ncbi:hypothetical protein C4572_01245 [Candidatus Parcubacteria bacterium]|nr:MAG: hypothetical protein C4572_01245 [Candidatus Parcubacteria bacterium]